MAVRFSTIHRWDFSSSVGSSLMTLHCFASAISVAVQALQKPKLRICEQAPAFNSRLLHLRCATAAPLGLIAVLYLHSSKHKSVFYRDNAAFALIRAHLLPLTNGVGNGCT